MTKLNPVPGFERHFASDDGRVFARQKDGSLRDLAQHPLRTGYLSIKIGNSAVAVHRMVALAFYGPLPDGMCTRHLNGDQLDNRAVNLRYGTFKENRADTDMHGRMPRGEKHGRSYCTDEQVRLVVSMHYKDGLPARQISEATGISRAVINSWIYGRCRSEAHEFQTPHGRLIYKPGRRSA